MIQASADNSDLTHSIERFGNWCRWLDLSNLEAMLLKIYILTILVFDIFVRFLGSRCFCDHVLQVITAVKDDIN